MQAFIVGWLIISTFVGIITMTDDTRDFETAA